MRENMKIFFNYEIGQNSLKFHPLCKIQTFKKSSLWNKAVEFPFASIVQVLLAPNYNILLYYELENNIIPVIIVDI